MNSKETFKVFYPSSFEIYAKRYCVNYKSLFGKSVLNMTLYYSS